MQVLLETTREVLPTPCILAVIKAMPSFQRSTRPRATGDYLN